LTADRDLARFWARNTVEIPTGLRFQWEYHRIVDVGIISGEDKRISIVGFPVGLRSVERKREKSWVGSSEDKWTIADFTAWEGGT
jgi:hypothetical protein